jgi:hypothetical protein
MRIINFKDREKLQFILSLLMLDNENPFSINLRDENNISCPNEILCIMLDRLVTDRTTVLPFKNGNSIIYLVLSTDSQKLIKHSEEIASFLVPVNAERSVGSPVKFDKLKGVIGKLGNKLFPLGYIFFKSPEPLVQEVFENLKLWSMLDDSRPEVTPEEGEINAYVLRSKFHQAIVLQKWDDAKEALTLLREGHYISDENYHFLKIQFLNAQGKWDEIWESEDFTIISGLHPLPKSVRKAMLTAFHRVVLSYHEEKNNIEETLIAFERNNSRLGTLISYRIGLKEDIFLRIFAYYATVEKDREKLIGIKGEVESKDTVILIDRLLEMVPEEIEIQPDVDTELKPIEIALKYYKDMMYDEAYIGAVDCENSVEKINILLGVATATEDENICRQALDSFSCLCIDTQTELKKEPAFKALVIYAMNIIKEREIVVDVIEEIISWEEWFEALLICERDKDYLADCMNRITMENQIETIKNSTIQKLEDLLLEIVTSDEIKLFQKQLLKVALPNFATYMLSDSAYPNHYAIGLYESLIEALQSYSNVNSNTAEFILRLSEGLNLMDINYCEKLWPGIERWFDFQPNIKTSFYVLEALTMFNEYGLAGSRLANTWYNWVGSIIENFTSDTYIQMKAWLEIGNRINADYTLLQMLKEKLESVNIEVDPIALLDETSITIFSLREKSARRAAESIQIRNSKLKVRVCTDDSLTEQAKSYASNSDICIIVTACLSHALFYGITPYLKNTPLYPRSSGETGIVEALENNIIRNN